MRWLPGIGLLVVTAAAVGFFAARNNQPPSPAPGNTHGSDSSKTSAREVLRGDTRLPERAAGPSRAEPTVPPTSPAPDAIPESAATAGDAEPAAADDAAHGADRRALNARLFADLPIDDAERIVDEVGLDRIAGMRALLDQARALQAAIHQGDPARIRDEAQEYLRAASKLQTPEARREYLALLKEYHHDHGRPAEDVGDIKDVLIPAFGLAQELARVH